MKIEKRRITVQDAAKLMGKSEMFIRIGLQRGILPFGIAVKLDGKSNTHTISLLNYLRNI